MLFSPVFARLQTATSTRFASPRLLQPSGSSRLKSLRFHACNLFRCNTYGPSRKCGKQRTYRKPKPFRCNTYKKHRGEGLLWLTRYSIKGFSSERPSRAWGLSSIGHPPAPALSRSPLTSQTVLPAFNLKLSTFNSVHCNPAHQLG